MRSMNGNAQCQRYHPDDPRPLPHSSPINQMMLSVVVVALETFPRMVIVFFFPKYVYSMLTCELQSLMPATKGPKARARKQPRKHPRRVVGVLRKVAKKQPQNSLKEDPS